MSRLTVRVALPERRDVDGAARARSWLTMLASIAAEPDDGLVGFPPRLARHLVAKLARPKTRGNAVAFLDALIAFGRGGDPGRQQRQGPDGVVASIR